MAKEDDEDEEAEVIRVEEGEEMGRVSAEEDGRMVKRLGDPRRPTEKEVEEHELRNHGQYRNWCKICVMARGKDLDHRWEVGKERRVAEYGWDYCFPGDEFGCKLTVLAGRERSSGAVMATAIPMKGSTGRFSVDKALEFISEVGTRQGI